MNGVQHLILQTDSGNNDILWIICIAFFLLENMLILAIQCVEVPLNPVL